MRRQGLPVASGPHQHHLSAAFRNSNEERPARDDAHGPSQQFLFVTSVTREVGRHENDPHPFIVVGSPRLVRPYGELGSAREVPGAPECTRSAAAHCARLLFFGPNASVVHSCPSGPIESATYRDFLDKGPGGCDAGTRVGCAVWDSTGTVFDVRSCEAIDRLGSSKTRGGIFGTARGNPTSPAQQRVETVERRPFLIPAHEVSLASSLLLMGNGV